MASNNSIYNRNSRYVQGGETTVYPNRLGWWDKTTFAFDDTDIVMTLIADYTDRPDKLAADVYGQSSFMWLILQYNNIVDINEEFVEGAIIRLPLPSRVVREIMNQSTGGVAPK